MDQNQGIYLTDSEAEAMAAAWAPAAPRPARPAPDIVFCWGGVERVEADMAAGCEDARFFLDSFDEPTRVARLSR